MRILIVEDDEPLRERLARALRDRGHVVTTAETIAAARDAAEAGFDAAVVDVRLGSESGLDLVGDLKGVSPGARLVVVSGNMSPKLARASKTLGAVAVLAKPFDADGLLVALAGTGTGSPR